MKLIYVLKSMVEKGGVGSGNRTNHPKRGGLFEQAREGTAYERTNVFKLPMKMDDVIQHIDIEAFGRPVEYQHMTPQALNERGVGVEYRHTTDRNSHNHYVVAKIMDENEELPVKHIVVEGHDTADQATRRANYFNVRRETVHDRLAEKSGTSAGAELGWQHRKVSVGYGKGKSLDVDAQVMGNYAVHYPVSPNGDRLMKHFQVTHIPTGKNHGVFKLKEAALKEAAYKAHNEKPQYDEDAGLDEDGRQHRAVITDGSEFKKPNGKYDRKKLFKPRDTFDALGWKRGVWDNDSDDD